MDGFLWLSVDVVSLMKNQFTAKPFLWFKNIKHSVAFENKHIFELTIGWFSPNIWLCFSVTYIPKILIVDIRMDWKIRVWYRRNAALDKYFWRADCWGGISFSLKFDDRSGTNFKAFFGAEKTDTTIFESFLTWISRIGALFPKASLWILKGKLTKNCFGWIQF